MSDEDEQRKLDEAKRVAQQATIETLYRYRPVVIRYMRRRGFTSDEAQDLTQKVFARVCQSVDDYRGEATAAYLEQIAKNLATNELRDRSAGKRFGTEVPVEGMLDLRADVPPADIALEKKERSARLRHAVAQLELPQRACVVLYLADNSYDEIARTLNLSVSAVKSRLNAARHRLRELMGVDIPGMGGE